MAGWVPGDSFERRAPSATSSSDSGIHKFWLSSSGTSGNSSVSPSRLARTKVSPLPILLGGDSAQATQKRGGASATATARSSREEAEPLLPPQGSSPSKATTPGHGAGPGAGGASSWEARNASWSPPWAPSNSFAGVSPYPSSSATASMGTGQALPPGPVWTSSGGRVDAEFGGGPLSAGVGSLQLMHARRPQDAGAPVGVGAPAQDPKPSTTSAQHGAAVPCANWEVPERSPPPSEPLASVGSAPHESGTCSPCLFWFKGACSKGRQCTYCHMTHPGQMDKRIRPSKKTRTRRKEEEEAKRAAEQAEDGTEEP